MVRVAIIGASGYTGADAIEFLLRHGQAEVTYLTASQECGPLDTLFGQFKGRLDLDVVPLDLDTLADKADVALCCLPHKVSMGIVPDLLAAGCKVVDLSADYRIKDVDVYERFYQVKHTDRANLESAVYGLPELYRNGIKEATLVANPGCFPTAAVLAAAPVLKQGWAKTDTIIVNAVTGVTGGGKNPNAQFHFPNMNENLFAYGMGTHRHGPEIDQIASEVAGTSVNTLFQPHAGPFDRGILSTVYLEPKVDVTPEQLHSAYRDFYAQEPFVQICTASPHIKDVARTNYCHLFPTVIKGRIVVFSAIDNLVKGASGQAIQNMNLLFGLEETLGLR